MPGRQFSLSSYRFGFNGQEEEEEINNRRGSYTSARFWEYDTRLGRRWNIDPVIKIYESPYTCFSNNPIYYSDPSGADKETRDARKAAQAFAKKTGGEFHKGEDKNGKKVFSVDVTKTKWFDERLSKPESKDEGGTYVFKPGDYEGMVGHMDKAGIGGVTQRITFKDWWDPDSWGDRMWLAKEHTRFSGVSITGEYSYSKKDKPGVMATNQLSLVVTGKEIALYYTFGLGAGSGGKSLSLGLGPIISTKHRDEESGIVEGITSEDIAGYGTQGEVNALSSSYGVLGIGMAYNTTKDGLKPASYINPYVSTATSPGGAVYKTFSQPLFILKSNDK